MNDKDIIKALRCCNKDDCDNCPNDFGNCYANLAGYALDLIKRQRSEIEKLERAVSHLEDYANGVADKVKAEAIKEFWNRLTSDADTTQINAFQYAYVVREEDADVVFKEVAGEQ